MPCATFRNKRVLTIKTIFFFRDKNAAANLREFREFKVFKVSGDAAAETVYLNDFRTLIT